MADGTAALVKMACGPNDSFLSKEKHFRVWNMFRPPVAS